ncbi:MAG: rod shape-determining protein MreD [Elusimicrobiaceae bacterium]|nr:rod shape-determining protein MreD [Elusimicrobiaceae bacterium]
MLRLINIAFVFIIATVFYWLGLLVFAPLGLSVNIMLAFTIIIAVLLPQRYGYTFAFFSGLFLDFLGTTVFGAHALAFTLLMMLFYRIRDKIDFKAAVPQMVITTLLNFVLVMLFGLLTKIFSNTFVWQGWKNLFLGSLILGLLMPLLYLLTERFFVFNILKKADEN